METNSSLSNTQDSITNDGLTTFYSRRSEVIMGAAFILLAVVGKHRYVFFSKESVHKLMFEFRGDGGS